MKKFIFSFLFLLISLTSFSQNLSYNIIYESISPIIDSNYWKAKDMWLKLEKKYPIDNRERLLFICNSYNNKDIKYFKKELKYLIKCNGFEINNSLKWLSFYQSITTGELKDWYETLIKKQHKIWLKHNLDKIETINIIEQLFVKDQTMSLLSSYFGIKDTTNENLHKFFDKIQHENYANLKRIVEISEKNNELPNTFDYPLLVMGKIEIIILHNLKDSTNFEKKWNLIFPYIEKAYFDGKISNSSFKMYDKLLFEFFGYQYYGTIKGAPIKDIDTYEQRKKKYKL